MLTLNLWQTSTKSQSRLIPFINITNPSKSNLCTSQVCCLKKKFGRIRLRNQIIYAPPLCGKWQCVKPQQIQIFRIEWKIDINNANKTTNAPSSSSGMENYKINIFISIFTCTFLSDITLHTRHEEIYNTYHLIFTLVW